MAHNSFQRQWAFDTTTEKVQFSPFFTEAENRESNTTFKGAMEEAFFLDHLDLRLAVHLIITACVLHNFCLLHDDFYDGYLDDDDGFDDHHGDDGHRPDGRAEQKRIHLMNIVCP